MARMDNDALVPEARAMLYVATRQFDAALDPPARIHGEHLADHREPLGQRRLEREPHPAGR